MKNGQIIFSPTGAVMKLENRFKQIEQLRFRFPIEQLDLAVVLCFRQPADLAREP